MEQSLKMKARLSTFAMRKDFRHLTSPVKLVQFTPNHLMVSDQARSW